MTVSDVNNQLYFRNGTPLGMYIRMHVCCMFACVCVCARNVHVFAMYTQCKYTLCIQSIKKPDTYHLAILHTKDSQTLPDHNVNWQLQHLSL